VLEDRQQICYVKIYARVHFVSRAVLLAGAQIFLRRSFELGPQDVVKFCSECVLSDGEEPCDIPDGFYDHALGQLHP
jgi:hypothetical protein